MSTEEMRAIAEMVARDDKAASRPPIVNPRLDALHAERSVLALRRWKIGAAPLTEAERTRLAEVEAEIHRIYEAEARR